MRYTADPKLADHKRVGKRLIAPWNQVDIAATPSDWVRERLPEVVWIGELIHDMGTQRSLDAVRIILQCGFDSIDQTPLNHPAFASSWVPTSDRTKNSVADRLSVAGLATDVSRALRAITSFYPDYPMTFLSAPKTRSTKWDRQAWKGRLVQLMDRESRISNMVCAHVVLGTMAIGKLRLPKGREPPNLELLYDESTNVESLEYGMAAGFVRSSTSAILAAQRTNLVAASSFWNRGLEIEPCTTEWADVNEKRREGKKA